MLASAPSSPRPTTSTRPTRPPRIHGALIRVDIDAGQLQRQRPPRRPARRRPATLAAIDAAWRRAARAHRRAPSARPRCAGAAPVARRRGHRRSWRARPRVPENGILVADSTQPAYVAHHSLAGPLAARVHRARRLRHARPGAADGDRSAARRAEPPVVALAGDGGRCSRSRSSRAPPTSGCPIALVIWQNDGYGEMRDSMDRIGAPRLGTEVSARDFVQLAEGFGCRGVRTDRWTTCRARWPRPSRPTARRSSKCAARAVPLSGV